MSEDMTDDQLRLLFTKQRYNETVSALTWAMPATRGDIRCLTEVMLRIEKLLGDIRSDQRNTNLSLKR